MFDSDEGKGGSEQNRSGIPSYLSRLTRTPLLTKEEERIITRAAKDGDQAARKRLVESNMRLVINIARSYNNRLVPLEDLIQEGAIGLMRAIDRFEPDRGFRFSTYATHWIRQAVGRAIDSKSKVIRLPTHISQTLRKIERARVELTNKQGKEPTNDELAKHLGIPAQKMRLLNSAANDLISLDIRVGDSEATSLISLIEDPSCIDADDQMVTAEQVKDLEDLIDELSSDEKIVIRHKVLDHGPRASRPAPHPVIEEMSRHRRKDIEVQALIKLRRVAELRRSRRDSDED
jgi:RNA polymerase primary sigma factor